MQNLEIVHNGRDRLELRQTLTAIRFFGMAGMMDGYKTADAHHRPHRPRPQGQAPGETGCGLHRTHHQTFQETPHPRRPVVVRAPGIAGPGGATRPRRGMNPPATCVTRLKPAETGMFDEIGLEHAVDLIVCKSELPEDSENIGRRKFTTARIDGNPPF